MDEDEAQLRHMMGRLETAFVQGFRQLDRGEGPKPEPGAGFSGLSQLVSTLPEYQRTPLEFMKQELTAPGRISIQAGGSEGLKPRTRFFGSP